MLTLDALCEGIYPYTRFPTFLSKLSKLLPKALKSTWCCYLHGKPSRSLDFTKPWVMVT